MKIMQENYYSCNYFVYDISKIKNNFKYYSNQQQKMKNSNENLICIECCNTIGSIFKTYQDGFKEIAECVSFYVFLRKCAE